MANLIATILNEVTSISDFKLPFVEDNIQKMFRNEIIVNLVILIPLAPFITPILDIFGKFRVTLALYGILMFPFLTLASYFRMKNMIKASETTNVVTSDNDFFKSFTEILSIIISIIVSLGILDILRYISF